jgi:hypothetical protein
MARQSEYRKVFDQRQSAKSPSDDTQNKSYMTIEPDAPKKPATEVVPPTKSNPSGYPVTATNKELQTT